ncbi:hypothetical protein PRIPAC_70388 [Pristionchus pacificus]|uniref:Uncharacterized protein n=1 Tax=Pristionchus pacificus TaxID=54126 RepID=A0A2A6C8J5_PRIPA|nr:hypothetical protein PRIPAC_70388 [Pristionchus pacificus]|eukprot:PDM74398.1 hypothetical protein PRIPAC_41754 [Pristionchus pacificus]
MVSSRTWRSPNGDGGNRQNTTDEELQGAYLRLARAAAMITTEARGGGAAREQRPRGTIAWLRLALFALPAHELARQCDRARALEREHSASTDSQPIIIVIPVDDPLARLFLPCCPCRSEDQQEGAVHDEKAESARDVSEEVEEERPIDLLTPVGGNESYLLFTLRYM